MTKENCLVEISVRFFKKGEPYWSDQLEEYLWKTEPQVLDIHTPQETYFEGDNSQDVYFEADNCSFSFQAFGQSTSGDWSNALNWAIDTVGTDEVFEDWLPDLEKMALSILGEANKKRMALFNPELPSPSSCVNFVTAWRYEIRYFPATSYSGEDCDETWELIGAVDLSKIPFSIMKIGNDDG